MTMRLVALAALAVAVPEVRAEPRPAPVEPRHPHAGIGGGVSIGRARETGRDEGWIARLDFGAWPVLAEPDRLGPLFGYAPALQVWTAGDDWGVGLPVAMQLGVRGYHARAAVELGVEVFSVEQVDDDTGVGLYQPMAGLTVLMEVGGWHGGVDARVTRRWQLGAPDQTQWQAAFTIGRTWEAPMREPLR